MPDFNFPSHGSCKEPPGWCECEGRNLTLEGKVVQSYSPGNICKNGLAILVHGKKEVAARVQGESTNVSPVRKGEGVGLGAAGVN